MEQYRCYDSMFQFFSSYVLVSGNANKAFDSSC